MEINDAVYNADAYAKCGFLAMKLDLVVRQNILSSDLIDFWPFGWDCVTCRPSHHERPQALLASFTWHYLMVITLPVSQCGCCVGL